MLGAVLGAVLGVVLGVVPGVVLGAVLGAELGAELGAGCWVPVAWESGPPWMELPAAATSRQRHLSALSAWLAALAGGQRRSAGRGARQQAGWRA